MRRLGAAAKLAGIVAGLAAVPATLYATAGNPLPAWPVDWGLVAESLSTGAIATSTWLQVVAAAGWLVWSYLFVALTVDVVATVGNRPSPVGAAPVRWLASTIVALATQLSTASMAFSPAPATVDVQVAAAPYDFNDAAGLRPVGDEVPDGTRLVVVSEGDSWAGFAQAALGDAGAGPRIRTLNDGRDVGGRVLNGSEAFVEAGWHLVIPAADPTVAAVPTAEPWNDAERPATDEVEEEEEEEAADPEWTVREGEHFWSIAEATLEAAHGAPPSEGEVASYWRELVDANEDRLLPPHDPDLIYPGQTLLVPPVDVVADATARTEPEVEEPPPAVDERDDPPEQTEPPAPDRVESQPGAPADNGSGPTVTNDDADHADDTDTSIETGEQPSASGDDADAGANAGDIEPDRTRWGTLAGLAAGTAATMLLGGGVLTLLRRRRRIALQRRPVQVRLPPLTDEQAAQASRLEAASAPDEVLDELAALLCSIPEHADPVLVAADDDGTVTLTFTHADGLPTPPPAPWVDGYPDAGGPPRWTAMLGARGPRRSIGLPLLVTLGRDGTATVLGNVAAMRLLDVSGDDAASVGRQLRAFALEVATSRTAGPVEVSITGETASTMVEQLRRTDDPEAEVAAAADEVAQGIIAEDRLPRLIVCHDPTTVPHLPEDVDLVGLIAAEHITDAGWRLHLDGHRRVLHDPDGRTVVLDSPDFDPDLVTDELAALDTTDLTVSDANEDHEEAASDSQDLNTRGWCEVGLLGPVTFTLDDEPLDTLAPIVRQVLAYLATHPVTTTEQLEDAVWAGRAAGSGQRVRAALTRLRSAVGPTPDGEPLVPRRGPGDRTLKLSTAVTCDLNRALGHLDAARRLDGGERVDRQLAALDLVRGAPFQDLVVSWTTDLEHQATAQLQDAAIEAATSMLEAGRLDEAEHAVQQGLKLCDPCEPLYVVWAQIEHVRGRRDRIRQLWTRLRQRYADDADDTFDLPATPTVDTERRFAALAAGRNPAD